MKVLMISLDNSIADNNSASALRMKDFGAIFDVLHIIVLGISGKNFNLAENIFIYPTVKNRLISLLKAKKTGKKILSGGGGWIITAQDPFETGCVGWCLAKKFGVGFEVQMHGDFYGNKYWRKEKLINRIRFYLGKFILRRANGVRAVSRRIKTSVERLNNKIAVIPIFTDLPPLAENFNKNKELKGLAILSVGSLMPVKNHRLLIEAFANVKKELPTVQLVIVGDGPLKKSLQLAAHSLQLKNNIYFAGYQKNLADFYSSADIFVHPSLYEGWGRAVVEAAAFGLPIVMSDAGLAGEVIKNNESGIIIPVDDEKALKEAILRLAGDGLLRKKLGEGARAAVSKLSDKQEYLNKIKEAWEAVI